MEMDRNKLVELLNTLNRNDPADCDGDLNVLCEINVSETCEQCDLSVENITNLVDDIHKFNQDDFSMTWKYICLNFHLFSKLRDSLNNSPPNEVLSVQQSKTLKNVVRNIIGIGICCNLQPNMPRHRELPTAYVVEHHSVLNSYNRLAGTTHGIIQCLKCVKLRHAILQDNFKVILSSLYQIVYHPLKKPISNRSLQDFVMTEEIYQRLLNERVFFKSQLEYVAASLHKSFYVRETMTIVSKTAPLWLQKAVSQNLSAIMRNVKGIETIANSMLESSIDYDPNDRAKTWNILDVLTKLIISFHAAADFSQNICNQLVDLLDTKSQDGKSIMVFESIYTLCIKRLYVVDEKLCRSMLFPALFTPFIHLTTYDHTFYNDQDITEIISQAVRLTNSCVAETNIDYSDLPIELFTPIMNVIFRLYCVTVSSSLNVLYNQLQDIVVKYLECGSQCFVALDTFLFDIQNEKIKGVRDDLYLEVKGESLVVKLSAHKLKNNISTNGDKLFNLCKNRTKLQVSLFTYLLNCLNDREKYFTTNTKKDLLNIESDFCIDEAIERNLMVYQLLSCLAEDKQIQNHINESPIDIVQYLENVIQKAIDAKMHLTTELEEENFQTTFTNMMILQALVMNSPKNNLKHYQKLLDPLRILSSETTNIEFKNLTSSIINFISDEGGSLKFHKETKSVLDEALQDVCDPLLPVRGHGLMTLTNLIEQRNADVIQRKQYILNIILQNLKNEDSFIYLSSIGALAAMGDIFPEIVIGTLTEEYSAFSNSNSEDSVELRMKVGEVLVRITKNLSEVAPKYKTLLLNTFLAGTKDDNNFMRASSLSNLGEICKVLGYKLGSIVTEVLVCVHAIITTDKAVEARRAAVTVIRQLLAGLESEMITFLKEDILEIYRSLKNIYNNDRDDVMRLQAQLALEELNENMKSILLLKPQLNMEKKIVVLN